MEYKVRKAFRDKNTMERYAVGETYHTEDKKRAEELIEKGYIAAVKTRSKKDSD